MPKLNDPVIAAVKKVRHGKTIQQEAEMRLRQLLPSASEEDLQTVSTSIAALIETNEVVVADVPPPAPEPEPASEPEVVKTEARAKVRKAKPGKKYDQATCLECLRTTMKGVEFSARDLADELGMGSAQGLAPVLNMLKAAKAVKRHKRKDGIAWSTIPMGLRTFIKKVATAEAA